MEEGYVQSFGPFSRMLVNQPGVYVLNIHRDMADLLALDPPMPSLEDIAWKDPDDESSR